MVYWIAASSDPYPTLQAGIPFAGLLNPREEAVCRGFKIPKRRHDWLLGRLAAKQLLQAMVYQRTGDYCLLDSLVIGNRPNYAPYAAGDLDKWVSISLSHSGSRAVCAAVDRSGWAIGIDIEQITRRPEGFAQEYLTASEINLICGCTDPGLKDVLITTIWSGKEAALKALQVGLSVDTKSVTCLFDCTELLADTWLPLEIELNDRRLLYQDLKLQGWRRWEKDYVITLVVQEDDKQRGHDEMAATWLTPIPHSLVTQSLSV